MSRDIATPLMQQYREIKSRHQDAILFFRMGDFYEMFYEDAEVASRTLGLTLTSRNNGGAAEVPLAGLPVKAAADYLRRLVQQGFRVAICEQVEDPRLAKGIVRREVVETITPGVAFADDLLDGERNNFLCAVSEEGSGPDTRIAVAAIDVSTGEVRLTECRLDDADTILARLAPRELLIARASQPALPSSRYARAEGALVTERESWEFDAELGRTDLARHYGVASLDGFGLGPDDSALIGAAGALLRYLRELQPGGVPHLAHPVIERRGDVMPLDEMTRRNLELIESLRGQDASGTLLGVLDRTLTPMGARMLRQWILAPLTDRVAIDARLDAVAACARESIARQTLREALDGVRDVERLASKTAAGRATPRELGALGASIARLPLVGEATRQLGPAGVLGALMEQWDECAELGVEIGRASCRERVWIPV